MHRIMSFSVDDIAANTSEVQEALNNTCTRRSTKYWLRGVSQIDEHVYFFLLARSSDMPDEDYVLAPLEEGVSHDDLIGQLADRWTAGFDMISSIKVYETIFLVFARGSKGKRKKSSE